MTTLAEIKNNRISFLRVIVGFLPLVFGFFLSVLFRTMDSLFSDDLMTDLSIGEDTLGILTATFLPAFAACLLPSGIALDRFGPRIVQSVMMAVTALGALIFSLSTGPFGLVIGSTLLGVGTASALLAGMKAGVTWFPRERLGLVTGCLLTAGWLCALAAAGPAGLLMRAYGWRALFVVLAALAAICSILAWLLVPTPAAAAGDVPDEDDGLPFVLRDPLFRRFAPLAALAVGTVWAIQGQWVARWLADVNGLELPAIISHISLMAVGQTAGFLVWGMLADWAGRKGLSAARVFAGAVALCVCIQVAAVGGALPTSIVWVAFSVAGAAAMLPLVVMSAHFPQAYVGRACASVGVLQYFAAFFIQFAIGIVVARWPHDASGQTSATAYAMAFMVPIALQLAALAWFLFPRSDTRHIAQKVGEVAVASFALLRSTAQSFVNNLQPLVHNLMQRRGAGRAQHQAQDLLEPPSMPGGAPADAAAAPADTAAEPTDTAVEPTSTAVASPETAGATAEADVAPADSAVAPTDTAVEPTDTADASPETAGATAEAEAAPADSAVAPTDTAVEPSDTADASPETADAPAEAEAAPADSAVEPTDTAVEPTDTADAPAETADATAEADAAPADAAVEPTDIADASPETADATAEAASAPAEMVAAPIDDDAVEPTKPAVAPAETTVAPTETALRSRLDATLSAGLDGVLGTILGTSAGASPEAALVPGAEVDHSPARRLSFPLVDPSHVPALNAVYHRRPPLAATIGGRQTTIMAAWPLPDRRPDVSHRVALRVDGEPGELWLPQSLLDLLVASVDPALSLDRLGPDEAAIILEFALDSALAAIEMDLGCKLAVDSVSGQLERLENDGQPPLFFTLVIEGLVTTGCELRLPPDYALRLAEGLDRHAGISRSALDLPMPVCLRVAAASLTAGEIERLSPDDVVLVDARCQPGDSAIAVIGERLVAPVALAPEGHRLAARPIPGGNSPWAWSMASDAAPLEGNNDNRPLHVMFEIGRFELSVSKVKQLAPNAPLPLGTLHDETVDIVVDGQRIGRGTLMQIGNRIGVHVTTRTRTPRSWREMRSSRKPR